VRQGAVVDSVQGMGQESGQPTESLARPQGQQGESATGQQNRGGEDPARESLVVAGRGHGGGGEYGAFEQ
jgi:hypothetical protein